MYRQFEQPKQSSVVEPVKNESVEKIPYVPAQRMTEKMTAAQKEGVRIWNLMRDTLLKHGLMEEKQ